MFSNSTEFARRNPLAVHRTDALAFRFASGGWDEQFARLRAIRFRGAIVGPEGSGKTTLLHELSGKLTKKQIPNQLVRAQAAKQLQRNLLGELFSLPNIEHSVFLLDSAEQLSPWAWWRVVAETYRRGWGLVVTVHRPCCLRTWIRCSTDEQLLLELLRELGFADSDAGSEFRQSALRIFKQRRGNIRETFRELYDRFADAGGMEWE